MSIITYARGSGLALTPHFKRREFDCPCGCSQQKHDPALSASLELLRAAIGESITVTSGYRCAKHNAAVGGASSSKHLSGMAADIKCAGMNPVEAGIIASRFFHGVGIYWTDASAFIHVDTRSENTTWLQGVSGESYRYTNSLLTGRKNFILPTIRQGSTGATNKAAIRMMQRLLGITQDGSFGAKTKQALTARQRALGITADGVCGPDTWRHISGAYKYM